MKKNLLYIIIGIILGVVLFSCTSKVIAGEKFYNVNNGNVENEIITKWEDPDNSNITCYITVDGGISCLYLEKDK